MSSKIDRSLHLYINPSFGKDEHPDITLSRIKEAIHVLINRFAIETDFHEEVNKLLKGKKNNINFLPNAQFKGIEFNIRLAFFADVESDMPLTRIDLTYAPLLPERK
jgi:hypothetical protein